MPMSSLWLMVILLLSVFPAKIAAKHRFPCPSDPFLSPSTDICNPLRYITSNSLTAVSVSLYTLSALIMTYFMWKRGGRFMVAMVVGSYTMALGLAMRFGLHVQPDNSGLYIVEYLFVILSVGLRTRKKTLVQACGGAISISGSTSGSVSKSKLGSNFERDVWNMREIASVSLPWYRDWRALAFAMTLSCIGILVNTLVICSIHHELTVVPKKIRSAYRTVELSQGFQGPLAVSEGFFYGLDTYPLFVAVAVYLPFWPGEFIHEMKGEDSVTTSNADIVEKDNLEK
ncbi:hypothetical protein Clacol_001761 [Clathrus columnatus]|uniref:Uncharacterized protein n=1 Tax=Clathrus columnatus TaxID=1419009 RepID=A0AAV4ZYZ4_9AGAM|nr:hypothetical protein Clacol_001761 [Clathrus columnatus]